jgi:hypothetical protein
MMTGRRTAHPFIHVLLLSICASSASASTGKKWGKVDPAAMSMSVFPQDTSADAVVLFDIGSMKVEASGAIYVGLERHYQIKILKSHGARFADIVIPYWHKDNISDLKAQTILPDGKKVQLKGKDIFDEAHNKRYRRKKFALPAAEAGAVLEVEYRLTSEMITELDPWIFQEDIPTLESEITLEIDPGFIYNVVIQNRSKKQIQQTEEYYLDMQHPNLKLRRFIYRAENMDAVKDEPYVSSLANYRARADFQIQGYKDPYVSYSFIKDLKTLCKELVEGPFSGYLNPSAKTRKLAKSIVSADTAEAVKIRKLYEYARDRLDSESSGNSLYPDKEQDDILDRRTATDSERNLLLMSMLRAAEIKAAPALVSTWGNKRPNPEVPLLSQYNRTIVSVQSGGGLMVLDANSRYTPFGLLPTDILTGYALEVAKETQNIISIPNTGIGSREQMDSRIVVSPDGTAEGDGVLLCTGYSSVRKNAALARTKDVKRFLAKDVYPDVDGLVVTQTDSTLKPAAADTFSVKFDFTVGGLAEMAGGEILLKPFLFNREDKNIFVSEKREFPVELNHRMVWFEKNVFQLPDGYELIELPKDSYLGNNDLSYSRRIETVSKQPLKISCSRSFQFQSLLIPDGRYAELKNCYARIVDADQERIILRKKP